MCSPADLISPIRCRLAHHEQAIIRFLREIVAIPSTDGQIGPVAQRVAHEMRSLGFDEVRFDRMGNLLGRVGNGRRILLYDGHLDTLGVGDPAAWRWDPFKGKVENGVLFARGACDAKGCTPGMVYALATLKELGLAKDWTLYYFGNIEEVCEGLAPNVLVEVEGIRPHFVVIGEPTDMGISRGQRGRMLIRVVTKGRSAHGASPQLGDNAIYKMLPIIAGVQALHDKLGDDPFLGPGSAAVTRIECSTTSLNAIPEQCTIYIDRRLTLGETAEAALAQIKALPGAEQAVVDALTYYDAPSYTGYVFPVEEHYPAWLLPADHALLHAAQATYRAVYGREARVGKWNFSTNGIYWMGKAGIPSIGFGPGDEVYAHTVNDQVSLHDVVQATLFYAALPGMI